VRVILSITVWLFAAIVVIGGIAFVVIDAMDKVESVRKRIPWIDKVLERRSAMVGLLMICIVLLIGDGYELLTKEMPDWNAQVKAIIPSADPGAKDAEIMQLKQQRDALRKQCTATGQTTSSIPLQCRAERLSQQLYSFSNEWKGATCILFGGADMNQQQQILQNEHKIESSNFKRDYLGDIESVSKEFKNRGLDTSLLDDRLLSARYNAAGLSDLLADELSVLARKLPQAHCSGLPQ